MSTKIQALARNPAFKTLRPVFMPLAVAIALLASWLIWSSVAQIIDSNRRSDMQAARSMGAQFVQQALTQQAKRMTDGLAQPAVQTALATGDLALAAKLLGAAWPQLHTAAILPPQLDEVYAELPKGGFGRLAVAESALMDNNVAHWVVRASGQPHLALAAPARVGERLVGVAYVEVALSELTAGLDATAEVSDSYIALRQGNITLWERGDKAYAEGAERMAMTVPKSQLRMVMETSAPPTGAFGLDAVPVLVLAFICLGFVYVLWRLSRLHPSFSFEPADTAPTLGEMAPSELQSDEPKLAIIVKEPPKPGPLKIDPGIFRAYDIRGVVGKSLDPDVAVLIGHAVGSVMQEKGLQDIVIGRDGRLSGQVLVDGLVEGLRKAGRNVIDIGMVPTPVAYFGGYHLRTGTCISVTGSHNPPDYNGFKIVIGGETLSGDAITDLYNRIVEHRLYASGSYGSVSSRDISGDYVYRISTDVQLARRLKVVVDAGNGVAGEIGPRVLEAIGAEVEELYCEIDGNFPNHHPDPSEPHNLEDLIKMVQRLDADIGIAFDGDGDRLGVVTRDGENIFADRLLMLFAADVLERNPGAVIVYDVKCTGRLPSHILRHGGSPLMWKTGHSLIKAKMRETGAELAGEMSGHFFFAERWYGFDDGIYAAARLLEILAAAMESPDEVLKSLPKGVSTPEIKVDAPDGDPHRFVERFREAAQFEGGRQSTIDGLRVDWPDGWGLLRASNTTPVLVMRFDADNDAALARIQGDFRRQLLQLKPDLVLPF
jgi:phosphomannomutase / phosphoglucomutase